MSTEIIEAEIVPDDKLVKYASETGLEKPATETLVHAFAPVFAKAREVLAGAAGVAASVVDATCVTEIRKSRTCRLAIRAVRLEGEAVHKKQKEASLRYGKAVDGFKNILLADLAPVEQALQEAEDTAERAEAARKAALKQTRTAELMPLLDGPLLLDLGELSENAYMKALADARLLKQAKIDAAAKAEAERMAKEKADREERERIAAENARLQAEAAEARRLAGEERKRAEAALAEERRVAIEQAAREVEKNKAALEAAAKKAKAEHDAMLKKLAEEQAARAKVQAELEAKAKAEREATEAKAREEAAAKAKADADAKAAAMAARKANAAPDRAKLLAFSTTLRAVPLPGFADETLNQEVLAEVSRLIRWLTNKAKGMV